MFGGYLVRGVIVRGICPGVFVLEPIIGHILRLITLVPLTYKSSFTFPRPTQRS